MGTPQTPGGLRGPQVPGGRRGSQPEVVAAGDWIIALPAWGERCSRVAAAYTLPSLLIALRDVPRRATIMIWTDQADRMREVLHHSEGEQPVVFVDVPGPDGAFESMSNCHRQVMDAAREGERVLLLTSDMIISREVVATCEYHLSRGRRLICCAAMRALQDAQPPIGASGPELLEWAWANRHPMTRDCTWPEGRSYDIWRMYFEKEGEVAARVFLPHPIVCVPHGRRVVFRPTIDVNLINNFTQAETWMMTRPEEGAVVEVSPADKEYLQTTTMRQRFTSNDPSCPTLVRCTNQRHRMFWGKKVIIRGAGGDCGDSEVVERVLG